MAKATEYIHMKVSPAVKAAFVAAAKRSKGENLTQWMTNAGMNKLTKEDRDALYKAMREEDEAKWQ